MIIHVLGEMLYRLRIPRWIRDCWTSMQECFEDLGLGLHEESSVYRALNGQGLHCGLGLGIGDLRSGSWRTEFDLQLATVKQRFLLVKL